MHHHARAAGHADNHEFDLILHAFLVRECGAEIREQKKYEEGIPSALQSQPLEKTDSAIAMEGFDMSPLLLLTPWPAYGITGKHVSAHACRARGADNKVTGDTRRPVTRAWGADPQNSNSHIQSYGRDFRGSCHLKVV